MITGAHSILYSSEADAVREFLRDVVGLSGVDAGGGWLIFALPPAELAVHSTNEGGDLRYELYLTCDDVEATLKDLTTKGAEVARPVSDEGWGLLTALRLPDGTELGLYEPRHPGAHDPLADRRSR
jgi:predicted enzyme related to lactoylglutathione lyase